jgi:hypothetical protein
MKDREPKPIFDLSDHYAQISGLELTEEQLIGEKPKPIVPADLTGSDPLVEKWPNIPKV